MNLEKEYIVKSEWEKRDCTIVENMSRSLQEINSALADIDNKLAEVDLDICYRDIYDQIDDACNNRDIIYNFVRYHTANMAASLDEPFTLSISNATDILACIDMDKLSTANLPGRVEYNSLLGESIPLYELTFSDFIGTVIYDETDTEDVPVCHGIKLFADLYINDYNELKEKYGTTLTLEEFLDYQVLDEVNYEKKVDFETSVRQYAYSSLGFTLLYQGLKGKTTFSDDLLSSEEAYTQTVIGAGTLAVDIVSLGTGEGIVSILISDFSGQIVYDMTYCVCDGNGLPVEASTVIALMAGGSASTATGNVLSKEVPEISMGSKSGSNAAGNIAKNLDTNNIPNMTK